MKKSFRGAPIFSIISLVMIVAMIVMLFVPYWTTEVSEKNEEGKKVDVEKEISISTFVWFPRDYKELQNDYEKEFDVEMDVNAEALMPAVTLVLGVALICFSLANLRSARASVSALGLGAFGIYGYLTSYLLRSGSTWIINLSISIAAAVVGLACSVVFLVFFIRRLQAERAALK